MNSSIRHIALFVPDLRAAERYYQSIKDKYGDENLGCVCNGQVADGVNVKGINPSAIASISLATTTSKLVAEPLVQ